MIAKVNISLKTKTLLWCGVIACPLFTLVIFIESLLRRDYNSFLYPLSSLAIGETGWVQVINFIITGILTLLFSFGLKNLFKTPGVKFHGPLLIGMAGIGLIGAGIFKTDPVFGYPPNQPLLLKQYTVHGHLHNVLSMLVFVCLPWACFIFRKRFIESGKKFWATYSSISGTAMILAFACSTIGFKQIPFFVEYAGLFQRLCIATGGIWVTFLSLHLLKLKAEKITGKN